MTKRLGNNYKMATEHAQAFGGVIGLARLTEAVKQSNLDVDAVYWDVQDCYLTPLFIRIRAYEGYNQTTRGYDAQPLLTVVIPRLVPVIL